MVDVVRSDMITSSNRAYIIVNAYNMFEQNFHLDKIYLYNI